MNSDGSDPREPTARGHVAILMATYNGARYLDAQLASIARQTWGRINVVASDDGSNDATLDHLQRWQQGWDKGDFLIVAGPGKGFAANFRSLILSADVDADYYAFADQDDVWRNDKIEIAIGELSRSVAAIPAMFCSRTTIVSSEGAVLGVSPLFRSPPDFRNALVQNIAGGNTMVLNRAAWKLLQRATAPVEFVSHDWWAYLVVTGGGGKVHYHETPLVEYRQHDSNVSGSNMGWSARMERMRLLLEGRFSTWNDRNLASLVACSAALTPEARRDIAMFVKARSGSLFSRLRSLQASGVHRQTALGQLSLFIGCVLGKI